jgi:hypothetical protein
MMAKGNERFAEHNRHQCSLPAMMFLSRLLANLHPDSFGLRQLAERTSKVDG